MDVDNGRLCHLSLVRKVQADRIMEAHGYMNMLARLNSVSVCFQINVIGRTIYFVCCYAHGICRHGKCGP